MQFDLETTGLNPDCDWIFMIAVRACFCGLQSGPGRCRTPGDDTGFDSVSNSPGPDSERRQMARPNASLATLAFPLEISIRYGHALCLRLKDPG